MDNKNDRSSGLAMEDFSPAEEIGILIFSKNNIKTACALVGDSNPIHLEGTRTVVPAFLVEGKALALVYEWAKANGLLRKAWIRTKVSEFKASVMCNHHYQCIVRYTISGEDKKGRIMIYVVDVTADKRHPACIIDLEVAYR